MIFKGRNLDCEVSQEKVGSGYLCSSFRQLYSTAENDGKEKVENLPFVAQSGERWQLAAQVRIIFPRDEHILEEDGVRAHWACRKMGSSIYNIYPTTALKFRGGSFARADSVAGYLLLSPPGWHLPRRRAVPPPRPNATDALDGLFLRRRYLHPATGGRRREMLGARRTLSRRRLGNGLRRRLGPGGRQSGVQEAGVRRSPGSCV